MITGLDHIAIAVPDLGRAIQRFANDFGLNFMGQEDVTAAKTSVAFFPVPPTSIELVHPLNGEGPIAKYLQKRTGGIHHLCFRSDNINADVERLRGLGYQFLTDSPRDGAHGCRVICLDPKCCDGVLIEINQPSQPTA